MLAVPL